MTSEILQTLSNADEQLLLFLNGFHNEFGNYFMYTFSGKFIWVPMYAALLYILLKSTGWKTALCCVVAIALTIVFADQVCATVIRPMVERMRPSNPDNPLSEWVHIVNGKRGGRYGFPSCHASNSFGLAFIIFFLFRHRWLTIFIFSWATLTAYSRIYLGVHYPGDLLAGALVGLCGAALLYFIFQKTTKLHKVELKQPSFMIYTGLLTVAGILVYATLMTF